MPTYPREFIFAEYDVISLCCFGPGNFVWAARAPPALVGAAVVLDHSGASVRILAAYSRHICELGHIGDARLRRVGILACAAPLLYERALDERAPFCYSLAVRLSAAAAG